MESDWGSISGSKFISISSFEPVIFARISYNSIASESLFSKSSLSISIKYSPISGVVWNTLTVEVPLPLPFPFLTIVVVEVVLGVATLPGVDGSCFTWAVCKLFQPLPAVTQVDVTVAGVLDVIAFLRVAGLRL